MWKQEYWTLILWNGSTLTAQSIWICTLNHKISRCIWRAAPDIAFSFSLGANSATKCKMLPIFSIFLFNIIPPTEPISLSKQNMLSWRFSAATWNMLFPFFVFHNRSKSKRISMIKHSMLPSSAASNRTFWITDEFPPSPLYSWRHFSNSSLACFEFSCFNINPGIESEKESSHTLMRNKYIKESNRSSTE